MDKNNKCTIHESNRTLSPNSPQTKVMTRVAIFLGSCPDILINTIIIGERNDISSDKDVYIQLKEVVHALDVERLEFTENDIGI